MSDEGKARPAALIDRLADPRPLIMGVLNVTPDSFSDGGRFTEREAAQDHAAAMVAAGADIIDVGGESTRPGSTGVSAETEAERVLPQLEALADASCPVSIDTSKPAIMAAAAEAGVSLINDVNALRADGAIEMVARLGLPVCLMHMQGEPRTMQANPVYNDVVREVGDFLIARMAACAQGGIARERILVDPGFGFGKTLEHNVTLLAHLDELVARLACPVLVGMSRKRMIGALIGDAPVEERLHGSVGAAVVAALKGARVIRVHDVAATHQALAVVNAVQGVEA